MRFPQTSMDVLIAAIITAEKKSILRAAMELGLSPSAVAKRIKAAERLAKCKLFISTDEELVLTDEGQIFYLEILQAVEHALLAEEKVAAYLMLKERHLLVGHSTYLPARLMAILIQFRMDAIPLVYIEHRPGLTASIVQEVLDGTLHVGSGFLPQSHPELLVRQLFEEPLGIAAQ